MVALRVAGHVVSRTTTNDRSRWLAQPTGLALVAEGPVELLTGCDAHGHSTVRYEELERAGLVLGWREGVTSWNALPVLPEEAGRPPKDR